jgi:hypothetical protein
MMGQDNSVGIATGYRADRLGFDSRQVKKKVNLMHRLPFTHRKIPGTHFCYRLSQSKGHSAAGRIRSIEKSNDLIRN